MRRVWWLGLGCLWLLDGCLSLQPNMGMNDLFLMLMSGFGQPRWLIALISDGLVGFLYHHHLFGAFNDALVVLQIGLGAAMLLGRERPLGYWALRLSIPAGLLIWGGGEWFGSVFALSVSFVTGGPGAALIYTAMAALLLCPRFWRQPDAPARIRRAAGLAWIAGAALQAFPTFWTRPGLTDPFREALVMTPASLRTLPLQWWVAWTGRQPVLANLLLVAACLAFGAALWRGARGRWFGALTAAWLFWIWWFGENFGALLGGIATDPNSAPLWALMLWGGWWPERRPKPASAAGP